MDRDKQIILGGVVLAALGGLVYMRKKADDNVGKQTTTKAELPEIKSPDDVDKLSVTIGDKTELVVEKKGDKWELTKPVAFAANQLNVKSAIDNLKELKVEEVVSSNATDDQKKLYELDGTKAVHVVTWKGAEKKFDATFGKSGGRGQIGMVDGKPGVYAIKGYSSYLFTREVKNWRDGSMITFDDANATQMTIVNKNGAFSFTKGAKWSGTFKDKPIDRFDDSKAQDALKALKGLVADDYGDGKTEAETGLDKPEGVVTVKLKDNAGNYSLKVGKIATGTSRYAMKEGSNTIYVISSWPSEWALADVVKFQRPADAGAPKDGGGKPEMPPGMPHGMMGMPPGMDPHGGM